MESFTKKTKKIKRMDDNTELGETNSSKNDQAP
jgi:hypothetical protein